MGQNESYLKYITSVYDIIEKRSNIRMFSPSSAGE